MLEIKLPVKKGDGKTETALTELIKLTIRVEDI